MPLEICNTGIGMMRDKAVSNLNKIVKSQSKAPVRGMRRKTPENSPDIAYLFGQGIIRKFGGGFYSRFMVDNRVRQLEGRWPQEEQLWLRQRRDVWESKGPSRHITAHSSLTSVRNGGGWRRGWLETGPGCSG